jgi:putative flippase GtrA
MVDVLQLVSAAAGFGPAMFLMYYTLRKYTFPKVEKPYFDDRRLFMLFALGVVLGMVLFAFERWGTSIGAAETVLLLILGFAVMESLLKLIILNYPKFQRKVDTAFYGLALGLGISSTFTFANVYVFLLELEDPTLAEGAAVVLVGFLFVLLHGSTTAIIGVGVARGDVKGYFPEALLIHAVFALLYESFFFVDLLVPPLNLLGLMGATAVVVYGYQKVHRQLLPAIVKDAKRLAQKKKA